MLESILRDGIAVGCFDGDTLAAAVFARLPGEVGSEYASLLGFDKIDCLRSADVESVIVAPEYRGNGLQELLLRVVAAVCEDEGLSYVFSSVAQENRASLENFFRLRYRAVGQNEFGEGYRRLIVRQAIAAAKRPRALLVIDYTYDFVAPDGKLTCGEAGQAIDAAIARCIDDAADEGDDIFVLNDIHDEGDRFHPEERLFPPHNIAGAPGRELYGRVKAAVDSAKAQCPARVHVLDKRRYSAFAGTPLTQLLRERGIEEVVLTGVCTDICVLHSAIGAYNEGFCVNVVRDAVASFNPQGHDFALAHMANTLGASVYALRKDSDKR